MQSLENKVAAFKLIARNSLRMNLINPRLTRIAFIEGDIKNYQDEKETTNHEIKVEEYEITKLDKDHPNYETRLKSKEDRLEILKLHIERSDKAIEGLEKDMDEQKKGIAMIESGETKVCLDDLNCLVDKMIKQDALNQVVTTQ